MKDKLIALFSSPRFQGVLVIAILQALVLFNVISSVQGEGLIQIIQGIIATAIVVKTVDRSADKKVVAAGVASGQTNVASVTDIPPTE